MHTDSVGLERVDTPSQVTNAGRELWFLGVSGLMLAYGCATVTLVLDLLGRRLASRLATLSGCKRDVRLDCAV